MTNPLNNPDPDFTSPDEISGVPSDSSSNPSHQLVNLYDLIAIQSEAKDHLESGHTLVELSRSGNFVCCSCGLSFKVGIIVDKRTFTGP